MNQTTEGVDFVFHQAALSSIPQSFSNPFLTSKVNATGTLNVLEASYLSSVRKVVFASSCAIYGDNLSLPLTEDEKVYPLSPYAVQKLTAEYYCNIYNFNHDLPTTSLRYFNVYGPRQNPDSDYGAVIPNFMDSVNKKIHDLW